MVSRMFWAFMGSPVFGKKVIQRHFGVFARVRSAQAFACKR
jgi:hypothetical protein